MSLENSLWGAPRIHGELLKLGIEVAQSTVANYMAKHRSGSGQTWKTFLRNHVAGIGAMDFLVVPTINFRLLFVLVILRHERRRLISLSVTDHPTAEWIARQITEAFPWDSAPTHLIRDRDASYGHAVTENAWITSSSLAKPTRVKSSRPTPPIATMSGRIYPWVRMYRLFVLFSGSVTSPRGRSFGGLHHEYCRT